MIVEEKKAEQNWCPLTPRGEALSHCIGSGCMAWRWHRERAWEGSLATGISSQKEEISTTHGYCGLAGGAR